MRRTMLAVAAVAVSGALAQAALAQQASPPAQPAKAATDDAERTTPRPSIRVLQHPYDISSFYRSGESSLGPWAGSAERPELQDRGVLPRAPGRLPVLALRLVGVLDERLPAPRPAPFPGYRRTIGENGDLFLMVPFLAPVGPISSAFLGY